MTVDVTFRGKAIFDLTLPQGIGLIHLPLKVTEVDEKAVEIQTIGDIFDLLGPDNVNFIITRDAAEGVRQNYLGEQSRGTPADQRLTDDLGIITVMKNLMTSHLCQISSHIRFQRRPSCCLIIRIRLTQKLGSRTN